MPSQIYFLNGHTLKTFVRLVTAAVFVAVTAACNPISPAVNLPDGQVVPCDQIQTVSNPTADVVLTCLDGNGQFDLADIKGPAVVNFWGSWCGPCREEIPFFVDIYTSKKDDLAIIGVNREERDFESAEKFIKDLGITYPQLSDPTGASKALVGQSIPVTVFIDENSQVVYQHNGAIKSTDELRKLILEHLGL